MGNFAKWNPGMWVSAAAIFAILGAGEHALWLQYIGWVGLSCVTFLALYITFQKEVNNDDPS